MSSPSVYPQAEDGTRRYLGYEPGYVMEQVRWLRGQSGLPPGPATGIL